MCSNCARGRHAWDGYVKFDMVCTVCGVKREIRGKTIRRLGIRGYTCMYIMPGEGKEAYRKAPVCRVHDSEPQAQANDWLTDLALSSIKDG